jgi:HEAT repeat protein
MPERRRSRLWVAGILGGAVIGTAIWFGSALTTRPRRAAAPGGSSVTVGGSSTHAALNQGLRDSDPRALATIQERATPGADSARKALTDREAREWLETLSAMRTGFFKFSPPARATCAVVACRILDRFAVEPAPAAWIEGLTPVHNILTACFADADSNVRFIALNETGRFWVWMPGRSLIPAEEDALARWKEDLHQPVVRCLASPDFRTRLSAIVCLGNLPIDALAAPAVSYIEDQSSVDVRRQALVSFAQRPGLLTEDMLLKRLHDSDPSIRETVGIVLKARGLTQEQISLGGLMVSPRPQQRASVISLIKDRTDIDPIVWLLQLSHDADETVRIQAAQALASQKTQTVSVKRRLAEMARSDRSEQVRQAASKFVPSVEETTAALPPLPGSSILNPKAN